MREWLIKWMYREPVITWSLIIGGGATAYAGLKDVMGWHKERRHPATTWPY